MTVMTSKVNYAHILAVVVNQESIILRFGFKLFCFVVCAKTISIGCNELVIVCLSQCV